jgi:hypothetical protein
MPTTRTAIATAAENTWPIHAGAAAWIAAMFILAETNPLRYGMTLQEDRFVEWLTVGLFFSAGVIYFKHAFARRRVFDLLVAAFCIFVAGEEFSWGQRLVGFTPPDVFLEHNAQQEFTLHNFSEVFGKPKGVLILALLGYGLVLPLLSRFTRTHAILERVGATPPPLSAAFWFICAAALLKWYPLDLTGEWVEALAGALFLLSARPGIRGFAAAATASVVAAGLLSAFSARGHASDPAMRRCAEMEARALLDDVTRNAATPALIDPDQAIHKRIYSAIRDGYLYPDRLNTYARVGCGQSPRFVLDVWGMPYWIRVSDAARSGVKDVEVYSMGPNRRRDDDDITAKVATILRYEEALR